ncbi:hypothetical protein MMC30_004053 [Trapelia coarctata]|nr:hypothetical protein [Trapelia coarctata]
MSFGFSISDFIQLAQFAKAIYRDCRNAGPEYVEVTREVRSLHSVLRTLEDEAQQEESIIFKQDRNITAELITTTDGCKHVLRDIDDILSSHEGLNPNGGASSAGKTLWHRYRFGSKMEDLATIRSKTIVYTSTISVLLDTMQLKATGRIESKIDDGFAKVTGLIEDNFGAMRKSIFQIATQARAAQRSGSVLSSTSLSTFTGNDKEVWRDFKRVLLAQGFRSRTLHEHKEVLLAYMMKLNQSGILDMAVASGPGPASEAGFSTNHPSVAASFESESDDQSSDELELSMKDGHSTITLAEVRPSYGSEDEDVNSKPNPKLDVRVNRFQRPWPISPSGSPATASQADLKGRLLDPYISLSESYIHDTSTLLTSR